ncbi:MAG TPA: DMT family transporter, partial [Tahibacter sp.]|nr:DMT family transporter [Tahibacter sp.]
LVPSLLSIVLGIACVNAVELAAFERSGADLSGYATGALLACVSLVAWTWYALRNARWLAANRSMGSGTWATAQGLVTLPLALIGYAALWAWMRIGGDAFAMPLGPRPLAFVGLMIAIGLFASWLGTLCWNQASQRLPTTLVGQLIVFETLAALAYAYLRVGQWPSATTLCGVALLIAGVVWAARAATMPARTEPTDDTLADRRTA